MRTVLHRLGHGGRKAAYVGLATVACHGQRAVFDDIEYGGRNVDHLASLGHFGLRQRQCAMAAQAMRRQGMVNSLRRLGNTLERCALVASLPDGSRNDLVLRKPSEDGGWLELLLCLATFDSSASSRSHSVNTTPSSSPRVRAERSGGVRFFAIPVS